MVPRVGAAGTALVSSGGLPTIRGPHDEMQRIGDYEVVRKIASGGTGTVYLARRHGPSGFAKLVAVKLLHPHLEMGDEERRRFIAEARIGAELAHPNVVDVLSLATHEGELYMVMEYVRGCDLRALLKARAMAPLPPRESAAILVEVLSGLGAAHGYRAPGGELRPVIHRDLKPRNILIATSGEVKITDFGTALIGGETHGTSLRGTFAYMSPEQARGEIVDARTDLFSSGLVLYELVTGRVAYGASGDLESLRLAQEGAIDWTPVAGLPPRLHRALEQALAPAREDRFRDAAEMRHALAGFLAEAGAPGREEIAALVRPHVAAADDRDAATRPARRTRATQAADVAPSVAPTDEGPTVPRPPRGRWPRRLLPFVGLGLLAGVVSGWVWYRQRALAPRPVPAATIDAGAADAARAALPPDAVAPVGRDAAALPADAGLGAPAPGGTDHGPIRARPVTIRPRPARLGTLVVNTIPTWSTVRIDQGAPLTTPVRVKVPEGRHVLSLQPAGQRRTLKVSVDVTAGRLTKKIVDVTVEP